MSEKNIYEKLILKSVSKSDKKIIILLAKKDFSCTILLEHNANNYLERTYNMISANNVTLRLGKRALFEDVNIKFTEGNCYGLIGANGAGKSTFLKILSGVIEPSKGDITMNAGERLSVLQQDHYKYDEYQVLDTVIMGNARLYEIMKEKEAIYAKEDFTEEDGIKAS